MTTPGLTWAWLDSRRSEERIEALARLIANRRDFENAVSDVITIVAHSPFIGPHESHVRVALIAAVQTMDARQWQLAMNGSDAEFVPIAMRADSLRVLSLLRATRRSHSHTDAARYFMLTGVESPTAYTEPAHEEQFRALVDATRKAISSR